MVMTNIIFYFGQFSLIGSGLVIKVAMGDIPFSI